MKDKLKYLLSFLLGSCLCSHVLFAQKVLLEGSVFNPQEEALELANVIACSIKDTSVYTFAISDYQGKFKLTLQQDSIYLLKVVYLGYEEWAETLEAKEGMDFKAIQLQATLSTLDEVTVVYKMPVVVRGDTVSFRAASFTNGKEKKLKDVFEKLPGFEVEDNGTIKVNGEKVKKITVDGKEFFTGDTKLASNNIPANVVEKVNVLRNHNDVAQMKSLGNKNGVAVDISLKADKQNIVFGSAEVGAGGEHRYLTHTNMFYFNKKGSINFIGNANNISEQVFTFQDIIRFNGGMVNFSNKNGASTRLSSESLGLIPMKDNRAQYTNTKVTALNFTINPVSKFNLSGFAVLSSVKNDMKNQANRTYVGLTQANQNEEVLDALTGQRSFSGIFKLQTKYLPSDKLHVEHHLSLQKNRLHKDELLQSENVFNDRYFDTRGYTDLPSLLQQLNLFYNIHPKHLINLEASQKYSAETTDYDLITKDPIYTTIIPIVDSDTVQLMQSQQLKTHKVDVTCNYYYLMNNTNHIGFSLGLTLNQQHLASGLNQHLQTGEVVKFDQQNLQNDIDYQYRDLYAGIYYKTRLAKLTFKPGIFFHDFYLNTEQGEAPKLRKQLLLPNIHLNYDFKKTTNLSFNYKIQAEFDDIRQYASGGILRNYNDFFRGNIRLENNWYHSFQMDYYSLNLYNFTNIYGILSYQKKYDDINNLIEYEGLDRISSPVNIMQANDMLTLYGAIDKRLKKLKVDFNFSLSYGQFNSLLPDETIILNENFSQHYGGSVETTMDDFPIIELGFKTIINQYQSESLSPQTYVTNRPFGNIEISFLSNFILLVDYEYNWYKSKSTNTSSTYDIINAELFFRKGNSPFEFKISALNILNTTSIRQDSFSDVLISTNEYFIQKRYFLGSLKYEF